MENDNDHVIYLPSQSTVPEPSESISSIMSSRSSSVILPSSSLKISLRTSVEMQPLPVRKKYNCINFILFQKISPSDPISKLVKFYSLNRNERQRSLILQKLKHITPQYAFILVVHQTFYILDKEYMHSSINMVTKIIS